MHGGTFAAAPVLFIGKRVDARRIDPAVVEIEQSADRDGVVDDLVIPTHSIKGLHVGGRDGRRLAIDLVDESKQRFLFFTQARSFEIAQDARNQVLIAQQFRRNCGVGLESKRTIVAVGGVGGN
jgi:hypothetical protein